MGENSILKNTIGGGNECRGVTGTVAALIAGHQQGSGGGNTGWSALTEAVKNIWPEAITR